jgi:hypothetical protein
MGVDRNELAAGIGLAVVLGLGGRDRRSPF